MFWATIIYFTQFVWWPGSLFALLSSNFVGVTPIIVSGSSARFWLTMGLLFSGTYFKILAFICFCVKLLMFRKVRGWIWSVRCWLGNFLDWRTELHAWGLGPHVRERGHTCGKQGRSRVGYCNKGRCRKEVRESAACAGISATRAGSTLRTCGNGCHTCGSRLSPKILFFFSFGAMYISLFTHLSLSKNIISSPFSLKTPTKHHKHLISSNPLGFWSIILHKLLRAKRGLHFVRWRSNFYTIDFGVSSHLFIKTWGRDFLRVIYIYFLQV